MNIFQMARITHVTSMTDFAYKVFFDALEAQGRSIVRVRLVCPNFVRLSL